MKKIAFSIVVASTVLQVACANLTFEQMSIRTPRDFLLDIKAVVDSEDLTDVNVVGRRLRIEFIAEPENAVFGNDAKTIIGHGIQIRQGRVGHEYLSENFWYRIFTPIHGKASKVLISVSVKKNAICVTKSELVATFGEGKQYVSPHAWSQDYLYERRGGAREVDFRFEPGGCLFGFVISDNGK
ncbi:hypothetical protein [Burkholderia ambifaria]|uniref:hypothetical protein n=1 Tax=Burkholderia ambifaria TaxID=152480 RepID=UPI00158A1FB7|nr:hypothetical protein [Burkholderia ambifaria]